MASRPDLLLGQIALEKGFISRKQLDECLKLQADSAKWKQLGMILLDRKYISEDDLEIVLEIQRRNLETVVDNTELKLKDVLLGRMVVARRLATQGQVNACLREQEHIERMGMFLRLGEILVRKGFVSDEGMAELLEEQQKRLEEFRQEALGADADAE